MKDKKRQQLIRHLRNAEENWWCVAVTKAGIKPQSPGGLTHVLQPTGTMERDMWPNQMSKLLLQHSQEHFSKAHSMPFTLEPLFGHLQYNRLTPFGDQIHAGKILDNVNISPMMPLLLEHQKSKLDPGEDLTMPLDFKSLMNRFKKWKEWTATSLSGRHFWIYWSLCKKFQLKKKEKRSHQQWKEWMWCGQCMHCSTWPSNAHTHTNDGLRSGTCFWKGTQAVQKLWDSKPSI